jgi:hypothetical protein
VVVELDGARYRRLVVTVENPDTTAATIRGGIHR